MAGLRDLYNRVEQVATPIAASIVGSEEFARVVPIVSAVNKSARSVAENLQARAWHALNLPAGSDVRHLRKQLGALDREVRILAMELEKSRSAPPSKGVSRRGETSGT